MKFLKKPKYVNVAWSWLKIKTNLKRYAYLTWRGVLYPFKQIWFWVLLLIVMFLAPTFNGVRPATVHIWYWNQIKSAYQAVVGKVSSQAMQMAENTDLSFISKNPFGEDEGVDKLVNAADIDTQASQRKVFAKASSDVPQGVDAASLATPESLAGMVPTLATENEAASFTEVLQKAHVDVRKPQNNQLITKSDDGYRRDLDYLVYADVPQIIQGKAMVYNANALDVNGQYIFLFGIYSPLGSQNAQKAAQILIDLIENKTVSCKIVAFSTQGVPTGICYFGDVNLNKLLVLQGVSKNIAL